MTKETINNFFNLQKDFYNNQDDIVFINGKIYSISFIRQLNYDQLISIIGIKPGMKLYKYCSFDKHTIYNIINNQVYLNSPDKFDDLFDSRIDIDESTFYNHRLKLYLDALSVKYDESDKNEALIVYLLNNLGEIGKDIIEFKQRINGIIIEENISLSLIIIYHKILLNKENPLCGIVDALKEEYINYIEEYKKYRITCFTTSPLSLKMWSLYADYNRGVCIEYTLDTYHTTHIFSILYSHIRGDSNYCSSMKDTRDPETFLKILIESILRKDISWIEQNEYRLVSYDGMYVNNLVPFHPITAIYAGNKISNADLEMVKDICKRKNIDCYKIEAGKDYFELKTKKISVD